MKIWKDAIDESKRKRKRDDDQDGASPAPGGGGLKKEDGVKRVKAEGEYSCLGFYIGLPSL